MEVLASHVNVTLCVAVETPLPESAMVTGEPLALLPTVTAPLRVPVVDGLKITLNDRLCPGVSVTGVLAPLKLNPLPLTPICEMLTSAFPVFVTTTDCEEDVPVATLLKLRLLVLKDNVCVALTPPPLRPTTTGEFGALLTMEILPVAPPVAAGENCTLNVPDCPGLREMGRVSALVENPVPVTLTCVTDNVAEPVLEI